MKTIYIRDSDRLKNFSTKLVHYRPTVCYGNLHKIEDMLVEEIVNYWDELSAKRKEEGTGVEYWVWNPRFNNGHRYHFRSLKVFLAYRLLEIEQWIPYSRPTMTSYTQTEADRPIYDREQSVNYFNSKYKSRNEETI